MAGRSCPWTTQGGVCYNRYVEEQTEVIDLKRWYCALAMLAIGTAVSGAALSLTANGSGILRASLGHGLVTASVIGLILCALLRPKAMRADAMTIGSDVTAEGSAPACTFADVAANDEARGSLEQLRDYIVHPEKYSRYGARMPKGVLLYGPPGTGKTLLAKALAGEAGVPFFALSGSDFVEKYVGVGAMRVRELFKKARKAGKCVIFIDEIDAMGKRRSDNSSDERDQTLNALLSEMSGFHSGEGVIVLAATNRLEMLDPALLRPGRFDRQIEVGLPGKKERLSILELHSRNKPLDEDVSLEHLAAETAYFSGASLENLLNEAAILAAARDKPSITMQDIRAALIQTIVGADRESTANDAERRIIALHEAGHAIATRALMPRHRLTRVSILPAGRGAAGYNLAIPPERVMLSKRDLENQVCVLLAGRAAELLILGEDALTAGASNDLDRATETVAMMVTELGMAGEPAVSLKALNRSCGGSGNSAERCRELLAELYARTQRLLGIHVEALGRLAEALLERETLTGDEVAGILGDLSNGRPEAAKAD